MVVELLQRSGDLVLGYAEGLCQVSRKIVATVAGRLHLGSDLLEGGGQLGLVDPELLRQRARIERAAAVTPRAEGSADLMDVRGGGRRAAGCGRATASGLGADRVGRRGQQHRAGERGCELPAS
jgi:hypothetical protein